MKLSEFKDEKGIEVVAKLLVPISNIAGNKSNAGMKGKSVIEFASAMLRNNPKDVMALLAILDDKEPEAYHCSAASILADLINMLGDEELLRLFGAQRQTRASSGSASENTEAPTP